MNYSNTTKKYNFEEHDDIPLELVEYIETLSKQDVYEMTIEEINDFLNEIDSFLDTTIWPWQDSGIESGF